MDLSTYGVSNDRIRALIGAEEEELTDEMLESMALGDEVEVELSSWLDGYQEILNTGQPAKVAARLKLYLGYAAAALAAQSAPAYLLASWSDGESRNSRFSEDYASRVAGELSAKASRNQTAIQEDLGTAVTPARLRMFGGVPPTRDPVTDPRTTGVN